MHGDDGVSQFWRELVSLVPNITSCTANEIYRSITIKIDKEGVCLVHQIGGQRFIELNNGVTTHNINAFEPLTQAEYEELPDLI